MDIQWKTAVPYVHQYRIVSEIDLCEKQMKIKAIECYHLYKTRYTYTIYGTTCRRMLV